MDVVEFTESLVKGLVKDPDMVKVEKFETEEEGTMIEIIVSDSDMGAVIGKGGRTASALRTLIQAHCYLNNQPRVKINIDSF
jgi:uncharacterized protein